MKGICLALAMIGMVIALMFGPATAEMKACTTFADVGTIQNIGFSSGTVLVSTPVVQRVRAVVVNQRNLILNRRVIVNRPGVRVRSINVLNVARPRAVVARVANVRPVQRAVRIVPSRRGAACGGLLIR